MKRIYIFITTLIIALLPVVTAYSYNADYMTVDKWSDTDNAITGNINKAGAFGTLVGTYSYYFDDRDNCIYCYFSVKEDNINTNDDVAIEVNVSNPSEEYSFSVDKNGLVEDDNGVSQYFDIYSSFSTYSNHHGDYIVAVDINNGSRTNYVTFFFYTRGRYVINDLRDIEVVKSNSTTTQRQSTTISGSTASAKTTKKATTTQGYKQVYEEVFDTTTAKAKAKKTKKTTQSKKKVDYTTSSNTSSNYTQSESVEVIQYDDDSTSASITVNRKMFIIAIAIAVTGIALILIAIAVKPKKESE